MKICILRRDGKGINHGMNRVVQDIVKDFFYDVKVLPEQNMEETTQVLAFEIPRKNYPADKILDFIEEISKANTNYSVRVLCHPIF